MTNSTTEKFCFFCRALMVAHSKPAYFDRTTGVATFYQSCPNYQWFLRPGHDHDMHYGEAETKGGEKV